MSIIEQEWGAPLATEAARPARPEVLPRLWGVLLLTPLLAMIAGSYVFAQTDPDYWWHVRTGQYIWETRLIPTTDPFSYAALGRPWVSQEWLTEVLIYLVGSTFGYVANVLIFGGIGILTGLCVYFAARWHGLGQPGAAVLMFWGFLMSLPLLNVRPQMLTMLFLACFALVLTRHLQTPTRAIWCLPALMLVWVNLHAGYLIGIFLLGLTVIGEVIARIRRQHAAPLKPLVLVALLASLATLVSPHGIEIVRYSLSIAILGTEGIHHISEFQSPDFHQPLALVFAASILLFLVVGVWRAPLRATELLWVLAFTVLGLQTTRHIPLYAVVVLPLLGARLQQEFPALRRRLADSPLRRTATVAWFIGMVALLAVIATGARALPLQTGATASARGYPSGAVQYLQTHDVPGQIFNQYEWGGFLIDQLYPQQRVFIDGRAEIYGDEQLLRYQQIAKLQAGWRETLRESTIALVLIGKDVPLAHALRDDPAWQELYTGEVERLFVRR